MKKFLCVVIIVVLLPNLSFARRVGGLFGKSESVKEIMALEDKGPNGEDVYLAYKTTGFYFFMGAYLSDDGYVLGIRDGSGSYYPLDEEKILSLQESGLLPTPLPEYKIPFMDWVWGFSLWILLAVLTAIWFNPLKPRATHFENGCKYYFGKDVPVDFPKAQKYFEKAAQENFAPAQYNLGIMYQNGQGVNKDVNKAISYYMMASDQKYANAQVQLGNLHYFGEEVPKNVERALSFYKSACNNGHQEACKMINHIEGDNNK